MSLQIAAQHLASKGRGPDTMLVHMAPGEVKSLQALARAHGGTLTTNPDTGLPEAGFLRALLPMIAGAALGPAGAGLFSSALTAGLGVGAATGLATGSLKKGLMAGLGAYGGAGLMGSVTGAGTGAISAATPAPPVTPLPDATVMGYDVAAFSPPAAPTGAGIAGVTPPAGATGLTGEQVNLLNRQFGVEPSALTAPVTPPAAVTPPTAAVTPATVTPAPMMDPNIVSEATQERLLADRLASASPMDKFSAGIKAIGNDPSKLFNMGNLKYGLAAAAPLLMQENEGDLFRGGKPSYEYSYDAGTGQYTRVPVGTRDAAGRMPGLPMQLAAGGTVQDMSERNQMQQMVMNNGQMYARGGISHLGDYSDGGRLLKGPGDGVSDSIPATIANKRPARLADGEFVVPARVVSELGNGSTEAGARKLYAMMDRVQKARGKTVGKGKVAVNSRAEKYLPA